MELKREREIHMLLPQTHSPEVDYSLFIIETVEMSMEKKETSPAGLRRSFPPPICSLLVSISGFSHVAALPSKNVGRPLIGVFRSRGCFWTKDRCKRGHEGRNRWAHAAWYCSRVGPPILVLRPPFVDFFHSWVFLLPK